MKLFQVVTSIITVLSVSMALASSGGSHPELFPKPVADKTMSTPPAKVTLTSPTYLQKIAEDSVTLKWQAVETADVYHVQVASDANFKWIISQDYFVKTTEYTVTGLDAGKNYFWRVAAVKSNNMDGHIKGPFTMSSFSR